LDSPGSTSGGLAHVNPLLKISCRAAGHYQACSQAGEEASPDHGDSRDRSIGFGAQPRCSASATASWQRVGAGDPPGERGATGQVAFTTRIAT
jgi:hypothetical protein